MAVLSDVRFLYISDHDIQGSLSPAWKSAAEHLSIFTRSIEVRHLLQI